MITCSSLKYYTISGDYLNDTNVLLKVRRSSRRNGKKQKIITASSYDTIGIIKLKILQDLYDDAIPTRQVLILSVETVYSTRSSLHLGPSNMRDHSWPMAVNDAYFSSDEFYSLPTSLVEYLLPRC
jgi:hypothetical protein